MVESIKIGNRTFEIGSRTYVMGILNVTPDSFSDGSKYNDMDAALKRVETMAEEGVDIIDIGGESTRPNHIKISAEEEISRVAPYVKEIKKRFDIPLSLDTYKGEVAKEVIPYGVDFINDIWGLKYDGMMASVIAKSGIACCLMHNRKDAGYADLVNDVIADLRESLDIAIKSGIKKEKIITDPGIGFAKTLGQNLMITNNMERLLELDVPYLLGASRKSMIGLTLDLPIDEREEGTLATSVIAAMKGASFVRVHDVKKSKRAIAMTEAIIKSGN